MLAEINLLPKKEQRNYTFIIIGIILLVLLMGLSTFLYFKFIDYKKEVASIEQQIATTQEIAVLEQQKANEVEKNNSVQQLKDLVDWSEKYPIKTVPLLQHLTSLLPERGFFLSFDYVKEGTILMNVQFDTSREASSYLDELIASEWTNDAKLISLLTGTIIVEEDEESANNGASDSDNTEDDTINEDDESNTDTNEDNESEETADPQNQQQRTVKSSDTPPELDNEPYVPRYTGVYEIKLNTDFINEKEEKDKEKAKKAKPSSKKGDGNS